MNGIYSTILHKLELLVQEEICLRNNVSFFVDMQYEYEPSIKETEDEPSCEEYFRIYNIRLIHPLYLTDGYGLKLSIDKRVKLEDILTCRQLEEIEDIILCELKEYYAQAQL